MQRIKNCVAVAVFNMLLAELWLIMQLGKW